MNQKKNSKKVIIILISILVILAILALVFLKTDLMKSEKVLFAKYGAQMLQGEAFSSKGLVDYFEKQKITPYSTEGKFETDVVSEANQEEFEQLNDMDFTFSGQVDTANNKATQDIQINYSDEVNFPFSYKQVGDIVGLQTKYVGKKYIAVDMSEDLGNNNQPLSGIISIREKLKGLKENEPTENEKLEIENSAYSKVINEQLTKDLFTKVKNEHGNGYKMTVTTEKLADISVQLLEILKDDQDTIDKLNKFMENKESSKELTKSDIEDLIALIKDNAKTSDEELETANDTIGITVYEKNRELSGIEIETKVVNMIIEISKSNDEVQYMVSTELKEDSETMATIIITTKYTGLKDLKTVNEDIQLKIASNEEEKLEYTHHYNNIVNFITVANIEDFDNSNAMMLNEKSKEERDAFIATISERIAKVNEEQMKELGLKAEENPISKMSMLVYGMSNNILKDSASAKEKAEEALRQEEMYNNIINETSSSMNEQVIMLHNAKFSNYEGKIKGVTVKGLLTTIKANNEQQKEEAETKDYIIKEINFSGEELEANEQNINYIKEQIDKEKEYKIETEKTEAGIIYRIIITEQ